MRAIDIIQKKRDGGILSKEELSFFISGYVNGSIPPYQASAWLMAAFLKGLDPSETVALTTIMLESGSRLDTNGVPGLKADKHSTGGVGDKTSLIIAPILAAVGIPVPMMSGRGLGHTGGTLDKLESIQGYSVFLTDQDALAILRDVGYVMMGQTKDMVPADRLLYALRDATGTVESIPLITASILSKKKAEGTDVLFLDVKTGNGAFMKSLDDSRALAKSLITVGTGLGMRVGAVISDMSNPLGYAVGNFFEVEECWKILKNDPSTFSIIQTKGGIMAKGPSADLVTLSLESTARIMLMAGKVTNLDEGRALSVKVLTSGEAHGSFCDNVSRQGGSVSWLEANIGTLRAPHNLTLRAARNGYVKSIEALAIGKASVILGAGRSKAEDPVLPDVGIILNKKPGDYCKVGEPMVSLWAHDLELLQQAQTLILPAITISENQENTGPILLEDVGT